MKLNVRTSQNISLLSFGFSVVVSIERVLSLKKQTFKKIFSLLHSLKPRGQSLVSNLVRKTRPEFQLSDVTFPLVKAFWTFVNFCRKLSSQTYKVK